MYSVPVVKDNSHVFHLDTCIKKFTNSMTIRTVVMVLMPQSSFFPFYQGGQLCDDGGNLRVWRKLMTFCKTSNKLSHIRNGMSGKERHCDP